MDSWLPGSSHSPSFPSEPPDIRNWFSSYAYESLELNTSDYAKDWSCKQCKIEKNEDGLKERIRAVKQDVENLDEVKANESSSGNDSGSESDFKHEDQNTIKIPGSLALQSFPSEPPDIGNWFPSYVYASPPLGRDDGFMASHSRDNDSGNEEPAVKENDDVLGGDLDKSIEGLDRNEAAGVHEHGSFCKVSDSLNSFSGISEPPDIRDWFSSFVYESPEVSEFGEFGDSCPKKDGFLIQDSETNSGIFRKAMNFCGVAAGDISNSGSPQKDIFTSKAFQEKGSLKQNNPADPCLGHGLEQKPLLRNGSPPTRKEEESSSHLKTSPREAKLPSEEPSIPNIKRSTAKSDKKYSEVSMCPHGETSVKPRAPARGLDNKESVGVEDGFLTTRRDRSRGILSECSKSKSSAIPAFADGETSKRRILAETTNLQRSTISVEATGKWTCPGKTRQKLGPPLKQLRLERWVKRL